MIRFLSLCLLLLLAALPLAVPAQDDADEPPEEKFSSVCVDDDGNTLTGSLLSRCLSDVLTNVAARLYVALARPESCIVCYLLLTLIDFVTPLGHAAFSILLRPTVLLLGVGLVVAISLSVGRILLFPDAGTSSSGWRALTETVVRFSVALLLLGGVGLLGAGAGRGEGTESTFHEIYCDILSPAIGTSVATGLVLLDAMAVHTSSSTRGLLVEQAREDASVYLSSRPGSGHLSVGCGVVPGHPSESERGLNGLMTLAAGLHLVGQLGVAQGVGLIRDGGALQTIEAPLAWVCGVLILLLFTVFLITAALRLVDPVVRLILVFSLSPLLVAAWVFRPFRRASEVGARTLLYAFTYFVMAGVVYGLVFSLITHSQRTAASLDSVSASYYRCDSGTPAEACACQPARLETFRGLSACVVASGGSLSISSVTSNPHSDARHIVALDLSQVIVSLMGLLLSQSLLTLVATFAGAVSDYQASENVAQAAEGQMRGLATSAVTTTAYAAVATGKMGLNFVKNFMGGASGTVGKFITRGGPH